MIQVDMDIVHDDDDCTQRLPAETLALVFDYLGVGDLIRCSLVAQRWREVAIQHHTYWSIISVSDPLDDDNDKREKVVRASLELAVAQLSRSTALPVCVSIVLHGLHDGVQALLEHIARHLDRINDLILSLDARYEYAMFAMLARPAPIMETLAIEVSGGMQASIPPNFLGGCAPQLSHLSLRNIYMPNVAIPHIMRLPELAVASLPMRSSDGTPIQPPFPEHIFTLFPDLLQLELNSYPFFQIPDAPTPHMAAGLSRLLRLHLWNSPPPRFLEWRETAAITKMSIYEPAPHVLPALSTHLAGELSLFVYWIHNGHQFVSLIERSGGAVDWYLPDVPPPDMDSIRLRKLLFTGIECPITPAVAAGLAGALQRVVSLCCPALYLAALCASLRVLPALRDLVIRVGPDGLYDVPVPLAGVPALRRVMFESAGGVTSEVVVEADDVVDLVERALPKSAFGSVALQLSGIRVEGWTARHAERKIFRAASDDDTGDVGLGFTGCGEASGACTRPTPMSVR